MARSDLLINLVRAGVAGDGHMLRRTVEAIVAEERGKQHHVLAERLVREIEAKPVNGATNMPRCASEVAVKAREYVTEINPRRYLSDLELPSPTRTAVDQLIEEQQRASILRAHSLEPRHRVLLVGPPGNGKTTLAEAIAESLAVSLLVVRYEAMVGSFLGETAGRLRRVFDYVRTMPCVLFFDEFDALGKERGDTHETGEIKRVVTSLLMQIDDLPSYVVVVAATNHAELLDRAVWRRFQLRLTLPAPTSQQLASFIDHLAHRAATDLGMQAETIVRAIGKVSYAEAEEFFLDVLRRKVLAHPDASMAEIIRDQIRLWERRAQGKRGPGGEGEHDAGSPGTPAP